jgi:hypothetical protein
MNDILYKCVENFMKKYLKNGKHINMYFIIFIKKQSYLEFNHINILNITQHIINTIIEFLK